SQLPYATSSGSRQHEPQKAQRDRCAKHQGGPCALVVLGQTPRKATNHFEKANAQPPENEHRQSRPYDLSQHPEVDRGWKGHKQANSYDKGGESYFLERQFQRVKRIYSAHEVRRSPECRLVNSKDRNSGDEHHGESSEKCEEARVCQEPPHELGPAKSGHERLGQHTEENSSGTEKHSEAAHRKGLAGLAAPNVQVDVHGDDQEEFADPKEHQAALTALRGQSLKPLDRSLRLKPEVQTFEQRLHFSALLRAQQKIDAFDYVHKDTERQQYV